MAARRIADIFRETLRSKCRGTDLAVWLVMAPSNLGLNPPLSRLWPLVLALAGACGDNDAKSPATERLSDAAVDASNDERWRCVEVFGFLAEPVSPGTLAVPWRSLTQTPWKPGKGELLFEGLRFFVRMDQVEAETVDGRTIACEVGQSYHCSDAAGLRSVRVHFGEHSWSAEAEPCADDSWRTLQPSDLPGCVAHATTVVEGTLVGYDASRDAAVSVALVGESPFLLAVAEDLSGSIPTRPCEVSGDHYVCTTIGYRTTVAHRLRLSSAERAVITASFPLEVKDCEARAVTQDVQVGPDASRAFGALMMSARDGGGV